MKRNDYHYVPGPAVGKGVGRGVVASNAGATSFLQMYGWVLSHVSDDQRA